LSDGALHDNELNDSELNNSELNNTGLNNTGLNNAAALRPICISNSNRLRERNSESQHRPPEDRFITFLVQFVTEGLHPILD
jgi:hypothetical protein